ncbi:MAG: hypothetical protein EA376_08925 [Phycisphaeraceae bacterium]|nr:MAG: hypothetical protein EA376_08925 [Phycisphaeraceae bacterium]
MFDQMKSMGAIAGLLRDKERLRETVERVKENLDRSRVVGEAGGGAVVVTVTGRAKVISVEFSPALCAGMASDDESRALAESLMAEATNEALEKAQAVMREEFAGAARELGLPDMPGLSGMEGLLGA